VDRWYAFLYKNREPVEALIVRANDLAERHKLSALRPLAATPVVLKLRDEEVALEKQARQVRNDIRCCRCCCRCCFACEFCIECLRVMLAVEAV